MKQAATTLLVTLIALLSGCGFHRQSAQDLPAWVGPIHVDSRQPNTAMGMAVSDLIHSLNQHQANPTHPLTLHLGIPTFHFDTPPLTTLSQTRTQRFTLSLPIAIYAPKHHLLISKTLTSTRAITTVTDQRYNPTANMDIHDALRRDIVSQLYYLIISNQLRPKLEQHASSP